MRTFATDANNDLYLLKGSITISSDAYAVANVCENAVKTVLGELELNEDVGVPYHEIVWVGAPVIGQIESALSSTIMSVQGVIGIKSLSAFVENNELLYTAVINTEYGEASFGL